MIMNDKIGGWMPGPIVRSDFETLDGVMGIAVFLLNTAIGLSALIAVVMIIVSGYLFITAAGDPDKIKRAQGTLVAAIIGIIIVFLARMIVLLVIDTIMGTDSTEVLQSSGIM